jgi:hypothetical protein
VKQLIEENAYREISPLTKFKGSGIYMIFIDHFTSNACVPIYMGNYYERLGRRSPRFSLSPPIW